jgi:zinc and cadmium transporter
MLTPILLSVLLVSAISLAGVLFLVLNQKTLDRFLEIFISFACGTLLGDVFLHLLPEMFDSLGEKASLMTGISFILFFVLEKFFYWRHCHEESCRVHTFTYLNLIGDTIHNFIDGTIIAASFLSNFSLGLSTTLAVIFHEIPQEVGDFSILLYGGVRRKKAILLNFLTGLSAVLGALFVYFFAQQIKIMAYFLPLAAGNFLYLSGTDIIPELHEKGRSSPRTSIYQFLALIVGFSLMWLFKVLLSE